MNLSYCVFDENFATFGSAAITNIKSAPIIKNCHFQMNRSREAGTTMLNFLSTVTIEDCVFDTNRAAEGTIMSYQSDTFLKNTTFRKNRVVIGGVILCFYGTLNAENLQVEENHATDALSGIFTIGATAEITQCTFHKNTAYSYYSDGFSDNFGFGGALGFTDSKAIIYRCKFTENETDGTGGAVALGSYGRAYFISCLFENNKSKIAGGAILNHYGRLELMNCTVVKNSIQEVEEYGPSSVYSTWDSYTLNRFFHYKVNGQNAYDPNADGYTTYEYSSASYATNGKFASGIDRGLHYIEFQTRNFSSGSLATVMAALPVALAAFEATDAENCVLLTWQTAEEKDVSHFSVERSPDGREWQEIGQVPAAGFSESIRDYSYIDDLAPAVGVIFYRLKMVDNDGTFTYSPIRSVEKSNMPLSDWQAWPNPVQDKLKVRISTPFRSYNLVNTLGQTVASGEHKETDQVEINCSNLADGVYLLQLERPDGTKESKRIVKLK